MRKRKEDDALLEIQFQLLRQSLPPCPLQEPVEAYAVEDRFPNCKGPFVVIAIAQGEATLINILRIKCLKLKRESSAFRVFDGLVEVVVVEFGKGIITVTS